MKAKHNQRGFAFLTTVLVIISVFLIMHIGLSMRIQQKANGAHRGLVKLQTDWLAASTVEQALASFNPDEALPVSSQYEVALSPSYIASDPTRSKGPDPRAFTAQCLYTVEAVDAPLDELNLKTTGETILVSARVKAPYRNSFIQSKVKMLCVQNNGRWTALPIVK
ncbi:MAG: hypothetical protein P9L94_05965 [Candidatus Hinthialibacter antarcticus]|nr:hypothetical protein [Candidatus Hinthialibacter antarcticus]